MNEFDNQEASVLQEKIQKTFSNLVVGVLILSLMLASGAAYYFFQKYDALARLQDLNEGVTTERTSRDSDTSLLAEVNMLNGGDVQHQIADVQSEYPAYVFENEAGTLKSAPLDSTHQPADLSEYGQVFGGGYLGLGEKGMVLAPNLQKFALLRENSLSVISVDNRAKTNLDFLQAEYVTGWSPDSTKLIVYVVPDTILNHLQPGGMQQIPERVDVPQEFGPSGFVLIDLEAGTYREMKELEGMLVYSWVGNDGLILSSGLGQNEFFVYYSLSQKTGDRTAVSALNDVYGHQMSFTPDGKIWSTVSSVRKGITDPAQVTLGNFPSIGDLGSSQFSWATRQKPVISPQGDTVALMGYEVLNGAKYVYFFDGKAIRQSIEGVPELWVDNSQLLVKQGDRIVLLNTLTGVEIILNE